MAKSTLRKYLFDKRLELYESIASKQKSIIDSDEPDSGMLIEYQIDKSKLDIINEIITICNNRKKF